VITPEQEAAIFALERPHRHLWYYYLLFPLAFLPVYPLVILPLWFRYETLRYHFTEEGISMRWGILFRREIIIQYSRIQDIHIRSNIVERWLGLARVLVQTASGNSGAEMTIEGIQQFEELRDFLYSRMRGVKDAGPAKAPSAQTEPQLAELLRDVARELRETRLAIETRRDKDAASRP